MALLAMQRVLTQLRRSTGFDINMRIGVASGDAGPFSAITRASTPYCAAVIAFDFIPATRFAATRSSGACSRSARRRWPGSGGSCS